MVRVPSVDGCSRWAWCFIALLSCGRDRTWLQDEPSQAQALLPDADTPVPTSSEPRANAASPEPAATHADAPDASPPAAEAPNGEQVQVQVQTPPVSGSGVAPMRPEPGSPPACGAEGEACCTEGSACAAALACDAGRCVECARFAGLVLPRGTAQNQRSRLSGDGRVVVANSASGVAYRSLWRSGEDATPLAPLPDDSGSLVMSLNRDGSVAVGSSTASVGDHAVLWQAGAAPTAVDTLELLTGVSADGLSVVGNGASGAARWTLANGRQPITSMDSVSDVSADGLSAAGTRLDALGPGLDRAVLDSGSGGSFVGATLEDLQSSAVALSGDGSVVVGLRIDSLARAQVFRWRAGVTEGLDGFSAVDDIDADGNVVVGQADGEACGGTTAIWRPGRGTEHLECLLPPGTVPTTWQLLRATSVSDDGRVISGFGFGPELVVQSWVAVLGPSCAPP